MEMEVSSSLPFLSRSPDRLEGVLSPEGSPISPSGPTVIVWRTEQSDSSSGESAEGETSHLTRTIAAVWTLDSSLCSSSGPLTSETDLEVDSDDSGYDADLSAFEDEIFL